MNVVVNSLLTIKAAFTPLGGREQKCDGAEYKIIYQLKSKRRRGGASQG